MRGFSLQCLRENLFLQPATNNNKNQYYRFSEICHHWLGEAENSILLKNDHYYYDPQVNNISVSGVL